MNILLTSVGRRGYLCGYFKKALVGIGNLFAANSEYTPALASADGYVITPLIYSSDYIPFLLKYACKHQITAIIPLFDIDAGVLAKHKNVFEKQNIKIITGTPQTLEICNDKWKTFCFLSQNEIATPCTFLSPEACMKAIAEQKIAFPVIVKPRWGMGSIGIYTADTSEELEIFFRKLQRDIFATYLKYESEQDQNHCVIIQEKINGDEFGLDVINDLDGNYVQTSPKRKLAMRAGETDIAVTVDMPALKEMGECLARSLDFVANLDVDCFIADGNVYVLEMNCRFGGQYPFSHLAGVDLVGQIVKWLNGGETDLTMMTPKIGVLTAKELVPTSFPRSRPPFSEQGLSCTAKRAGIRELTNFYLRVSNYFSPSLTERTDVAAVAEKIVRNGFSVEAWHCGTLIGLVSGYMNDYVTHRSYINVVAVDQGFQHCGIASFLIRNFIQYAKCHGMKTITLNTELENIAALSLYQYLGFKETFRKAPKVQMLFEL